MKLDARWIWKKQDSYDLYNQTIAARRRFDLDGVRRAELAITADSFYRLYINGEWVNDGPCRSWPEHYQYDVIDVTSYLRAGENTLEVVAKYFGVGTFHQVPQQAGLLAQLEVEVAEGRFATVVTDGSWEVAEIDAWRRNVPKISIQMPPFECYDARKTAGIFEPAAELYTAYEGPWRDLQPRDCPLLTRQPEAIRSFREASVVRRDWHGYTFPAARLLYPGLIEANHFLSTPHAVATVVVAERPGEVRLGQHGYRLSVNGAEGRDGVFALQAGANLLLGVSRPFLGHQEKETHVRFESMANLRLENPVEPGHANPWCFVPLEEGKYVGNDLVWPGLNPEEEPLRARIHEALEALLAGVHDADTFRGRVGSRAQTVAANDMLLIDPHRQFMAREVVGDGTAHVEGPGNLIYDTPDMTVVHPSADGDVELLYDLGRQDVGYYDFELIAPAGTVIDVFGVEYITPTGKIQHTGDNHNGLRYVCHQGLNRFTSLMRRSGRYLFLTFREMTAPVRVRRVQLIESTYPVQPVGAFACSDARLGEIWGISAHTLKLCMEDTFTDCPLYEQTLWVGDARNEAVFAFTAFGAEDLARRCIRLAGESLERYPLVGCQVPSCWDTLLPAWSFLWGISVWDYYFHTGDRDFLRASWGWVRKNLDSAADHRDERGLFSGPYWNMFDWSGIDDNHRTVLHNTMLMVGAIDAALRCAEVLDDGEAASRYTRLREEMVQAVNALWDPARAAYPDSIHEDGTISERVSQHTSFLGLLYDAVPEDRRQAALRNCLNPPEDMVRVGAPFAIQYLYEALEKEGLHEPVLKSIYDAYLPMLESGATTVWESFASGSLKRDEFPTRSHTHAWSSAPLYFLNRIVLGIRQTAPGGAAYEVSPFLGDLTWARGATAGARGPVSVAWVRDGQRLAVTATAPKDVRVSFAMNDSLQGLEVTFNGTAV